MEEKTQKSRIVFRGPFFLLREHDFVTQGGIKGKRVILEHPGAVAAVPLLSDGRLLLVQQYRKAAEQEMLEIPAGKIKKGETLTECLQRELAEETGFRAGRLDKLLSYYPSPGISNEVIHIYLARELQEIESAAFDEISLKKVVLSLPEVKRRISSGKIQDSKTIIGVWALDQLIGR